MVHIKNLSFDNLVYCLSINADEYASDDEIAINLPTKLGPYNPLLDYASPNQSSALSTCMETHIKVHILYSGSKVIPVNLTQSNLDTKENTVISKDIIKYSPQAVILDCCTINGGKTWFIGTSQTLNSGVDYLDIKNKPFGVDYTDVKCVLPQTTFVSKNVPVGGGEPGASHGVFALPNDLIADPKVGDEVIVELDGVRYYGNTFSDYYGGESLSLGGDPIGQSMNPPFALWYKVTESPLGNLSQFNSDWVFIVEAPDEDGVEHTLALYTAEGGKINKITSQYLDIASIYNSHVTRSYSEKFVGKIKITSSNENGSCLYGTVTITKDDKVYSVDEFMSYLWSAGKHCFMALRSDDYDNDGGTHNPYYTFYLDSSICLDDLTMGSPSSGEVQLHTVAMWYNVGSDQLPINSRVQPALVYIYNRNSDYKATVLDVIVVKFNT